MQWWDDSQPLVHDQVVLYIAVAPVSVGLVFIVTAHHNFVSIIVIRRALHHNALATQS